jgi:hypothetical protein
MIATSCEPRLTNFRSAAVVLRGTIAVFGYPSCPMFGVLMMMPAVVIAMFSSLVPVIAPVVIVRVVCRVTACPRVLSRM